MSHTPAPWGFTYDGSSDYAIGPASDPQVDRIGTLHGRHVKIEDVRLITAAPELLEALKRIRDLDINCSQQEDKAAWAQAHAAIAKAEGAP